MGYARRFSTKADANQPEIVAALKAVGCSVVDLSGIGKGCPDLLCGREGRTYLVECKGDPKITHRSARSELTDDQVAFAAAWRGGIIHVVHSVEEALLVVLPSEDAARPALSRLDAGGGGA